MTIIVPNGAAAPAGQLIQRTSSWTFAAGSTGSVAAHIVFTITGRVFVDLVTAHCTTTLTSAGTPAITLGTTNDVDAFMAAPTGGGPGLATGDWWTVAASSAGAVGPLSVVTGDRVTSNRFKLLSENVVLDIPVSTLTGGVLVFDVWYYPITSDGELAVTTPA